MNAYNILSQNAFWRINKAITRHLEDIEASALLSFLIDKEAYHQANGSMKGSEGEQWFYATAEAIEDELFIKYRKQKTAIKALEDAGFIRSKVMGSPAKTHFSIDHEAITFAVTQNKYCGSVKTRIDKNAKLELTKTQNYNKNKDKNKEIREREDAPELSEADKFIAAHTPPRSQFDPFGKESKPKYQGGTEQDYKAIYDAIADHLNSNPRTWSEIASLAFCKMTPSQFKTELKSWIRYYLLHPRLFANPVQNLRGGRISFVGWLKKPWAQEKYNPERAKENQPRSTAGTRRTVAATKSKG